MKSASQHRLILALTALSLSACGPAPTSQPGTGTPPSSLPSASTSPVPGSGTTPTPGATADPAGTASLRFRLVADPSLARFQTTQVDDFTLCLTRIASVSTRFSFNGALSAAAAKTLRDAGATVETSGDSQIITFNRPGGLAQLLAGIGLTLSELPAVQIEGRSTFLDSNGLELGFVTWQVSLSGGARDVTVTLSEADGASNPVSNACPRLRAKVSGATLRGAGGQIGTDGTSGTGASPSPGATNAPGTGDKPSLPTGLQVVEQGETYLTLQWEFPADARSFKLFLDGREVAANHVTPNYYRFEGLRASTNYTLGVSAVNDDGESAIADIRGTTLSAGGRNASGNFSSGGNGNTSHDDEDKTGEIVLLSDPTTSNDTQADIAVNQDGNYVVVWTEQAIDESYPPDMKIHVQRYDVRDRKRGEYVIELGTMTGTPIPSVAIDDSGDFVVSWGTDYTDTIYAEQFSANGTPHGIFPVNSDTSGNKQYPAVAMDDDGNFVIAWIGDGAQGQGIYARRFDEDGEPDGSDFRVSGTTNTYGLPDIAMDRDGDFVIVWQEFYENTVRAQRFDSEAGPVGVPILVSESNDVPFTYFGHTVSVSMNDSGAFTVAWPEGDNNSYGVYASVYSRTGEPEAERVLVTDTAQSSAAIRITDVAMDNQGDFVVTWPEKYNTNNSFQVKGRYFEDNAPKGEVFLVHDDLDGATSVAYFDPAVAMDADGDFIVTWTQLDFDFQSTGADVYKRSFR